MSTWILSNAASDLSGGDDFSNDLEDSPRTAADLNISVPASTIETNMAWTMSGVPNNTSWATGDITVEVEVTNGGNLKMSINAHRVNASGTIQESQSETSQQTITFTGSYTFTISGASWSSPAATDRLRIDYIVENTLTMGTQTGKIQANTVIVEVITSIVDNSGSPNHPSPTSLEAERTTNPTNASEAPIFSAIAETNGSEIIDEAFIEVAEDSGFITIVGSSGWKGITNVTDGNRTDEIKYNNSWTTFGVLDSKLTYYWRIKLRDTGEVESDWSANATIAGFIREWEYGMLRRKLTFNTEHLPATTNYTATFDLQTGDRTKIADIGHWNEGIQASGGQQIAYFGAKKHVVIQGRGTLTDETLQWYVVTYDASTDSWGTPTKIWHEYTTFDLHNFPVIECDNDGYLHVLWGSHTTTQRYMRSQNPNDSSSWWNPNSELVVPMDLFTNATYPQMLTIPSTGRLYAFVRGGDDTFRYQYVFKYSDDNGQHWSGQYVFIKDTSSDKYRVYMYASKLDLKTERLHIAYNYMKTYQGVVDIPVNVYYAYCDYDSGVTEGFRAWKGAGGASIGTSLSNPIDDRTDGNPAITSDATIFADQVNWKFAVEMHVTASGKAIPLFINSVWPPNNAFRIEQVHLECATWSGATMDASGSWTIHKVSEQCDLMRSQMRTGNAIYENLEGDIHTWMSSMSETWLYQQPTADGNYTNCTRDSGAASFYTYIDDGIVDTDISNYLFATGTGEFSCTGSGTFDLPDGATILELEVVATVRRHSGGTPTASVFLRASSTDYPSTTFSIPDHPAWFDDANEGWPSNTLAEDIYYDIKYAWDENPDTTSAWTATSAKEMEVGFKWLTGGETIRLAKLIKRLKIQKQADAKTPAGEIYELISTDGGATWSIRSQVSGNTELGVPIVNGKQQYTNNEMDVIWSSGNSIFHLTDNQFGRMRSDGKDVRIFHGATQLDRLTAGFNLNPSTIHFKLPAALGVDDVALDDDLFVEYGNPNETTQALSDPDNIYDEFHSFQELNISKDGTISAFADAGGGDVTATIPTGHGLANSDVVIIDGTTNYDGQYTISSVTSTSFDFTDTWVATDTGTWQDAIEDGWTINSGQVLIYGGPPDQYNKVGSPTKVMELVGAAEIERTLGSGLLDVYVEWLMWYESAGDKQYIALADSGGDEFGCGLNEATDVAVYLVDTGTPTFTDSTIAATRRQYHKYAIQVTSQGCSCWIDGNLIVGETSAITSVDKLIIRSTGKLFVDHIKVMMKLSKTNSTVDTTISSFTDATTLQEANHPVTYNETNDAKHDITQTALQKIEVKVSLQADIGQGSGHNIDLHCWLSDSNPYDNTSVQDETRNVTGVSETTSFTTFTFTMLDWTKPKSVKLDHYGGDIALVTVLLSEIKVYKQQLDPVITVGAEESRGLIGRATLSGAGLKSLTGRANIGDNFIKVAGPPQLEHSTEAAAPGVAVLENKAVIAAISAQPVLEHSAVIAALQLQSVLEYSELTGSMPVLAVIEYLELTQSLLASVRIEYAAAVNALRHIIVEAPGTGFISRGVNIRLEYLRAIINEASVQVEHSKTTDLKGRAVVAFEAAASVPLAVPVEHSEVTESMTAAALIEHTEATKSLRANIALEHLAGIVAGRKIPVENTADFVSMRSIPMEHSVATEVLLADISLEHLEAITRRGRIPTAYLSDLARAGHISIEHGGFVSARRQVVTEELLAAISLRNIPLEHSDSTGSMLLSVPIEELAGVVVPGTVVVEYLGTFAMTRLASIQLEHLTALSRKNVARLEELESLARSGHVPNEWLESTAAILVVVQVEHILDLVRDVSIQLEHSEVTLSMTGVSVFENLEATKTLIAEVRLEYLSAIDKLTHVQMENLGEVELTSKGIVQLEHLQSLSRNGAALLEELTSLAKSGAIPNEWLESISALVSVQVEHIQDLVRGSSVQVEHSELTLSLKGVTVLENLEATAALLADVRLEYVAALARSGVVQMENLGEVELTSKGIVQLEHLLDLVREASIPLGHNQLVEAMRHAQVEWLQVVSIVGQVVTERLMAVNAKVQVVAGWQSAATFTKTTVIPIEHLSGAQVPGAPPLERLRDTTRNAQMNLEYKTNVLARLQTNVEHMVGFTTDLHVSVEHLRALMRQANIPNGWSGTAFAAVAIINARLNAPTIANVVLTATELTNLNLLLHRLGALNINAADIDNVVLNLARTIAEEELKGGS